MICFLFRTGFNDSDIYILFWTGFVCGTCHLEQYNTIKEELPLAKPGWQRRKHDEKKEIPDHLKLKKKMPPLCELNKITGQPGPVLIHGLSSHRVVSPLGTETMPICVVDSDQETNTSMASDEVMDLSMMAPNDKYLSRPRPDLDTLGMTPPKKRRFDHQNCDNSDPMALSSHRVSPPIPVTLPPR